MALIKNLSSRKLKRMQKQLELLEFYGLTEEDIKMLPKLIEENKVLKNSVHELEAKFDELLKTLETINAPSNVLKRDLGDIAKQCFTLPEVE